MIEREHASLSIERQCELLGVSRSGLYSVPEPIRDDEEGLMATIDKIYTTWPFYGYRRITAELFKRGNVVNHKRVLRLMRKMNIASIAPGPLTSTPHPEHKKYPYLLRNVPIVRPDQVWCTDITYLPMARGHLYLMAILDWYSRHVLAWRLSNTCEVGFCLDALDEALSLGRKPEIFNSDQGSQFTSEEFTGRLLGQGIQISMDGKGRALDNVIVERFWRNVKYEYVYLYAPATGLEMHQGLKNYMDFYCHRRGHETLQYAVPAAVYSAPKNA